MGKEFDSLFSIVRFSPARRIQIYRRILVMATALGLARLVALLDEALAHDVKARALLEQTRGKKRGNLYAVAVRPIDVKADHTLSGLRAAALGLASGLPATHPTAVAVTELIKGIFPHGVGAVTGLRYIEQVAAIENIVVMLRSTHAQHVATLGLAAKVDQLAEVTAEYRSAVDRGRDSDDGTAARAAAPVPARGGQPDRYRRAGLGQPGAGVLGHPGSAVGAAVRTDRCGARPPQPRRRERGQQGAGQ